MSEVDQEAPDEDDDEPDLLPFELNARPEHEGTRLDHFLRDELPDRSRALIQKHIESGAVTIEGQLPKRGASTQLKGGDHVRYTPPPPLVVTLSPEDIPLSILFEDEHLVAVDKPRGLVVHPGAGHPSGTLVNALLHHFGRTAVRNAGTVRPGIVHRLDRDTTGVIVVAKNERVHELLGRAFHERQIEKRYLAVTHGEPTVDSMRLETLFGRHPKERKKFSSKVTSGKNAITAFKVEERLQLAAVLAIDLYTGRTHQIRVHLADYGHPLIGDTTYGRKAHVHDPKTGAVIAAFDRPALHAQRIAFEHPITGAPIDISAPIPEDLTTLIASLRARIRAGKR